MGLVVMPMPTVDALQSWINSFDIILINADGNFIVCPQTFLFFPHRNLPPEHYGGREQPLFSDDHFSSTDYT